MWKQEPRGTASGDGTRPGSGIHLERHLDERQHALEEVLISPSNMLVPHLHCRASATSGTIAPVPITLVGAPTARRAVWKSVGRRFLAGTNGLLGRWVGMGGRREVCWPSTRRGEGGREALCLAPKRGKVGEAPPPSSASLEREMKFQAREHTIPSGSMWYNVILTPPPLKKRERQFSPTTGVSGADLALASASSDEITEVQVLPSGAVDAAVSY